MNYYFIGGLGSNHYHAKDLSKFLDVSVEFLSLPGHKGERCLLTSKEDLENWFSQRVDISNNMVLLGHSIGADIVAYLATRFSEIQSVILLEGGFLDLDRILPLDEEIAGAKTYMEATAYQTLEELVEQERSENVYWTAHLERAVRESVRFEETSQTWRLNLEEESILSLLILRRELVPCLQESLTKKVLLILADLKGQGLEWRDEALQNLPSWVKVVSIADTSHSLYTEKPRQVGEIISNFLANL